MPIVVVLVSGLVFPRSICVQFQVPVRNIIDEKSGFTIGTMVAAGAGWAVEATGAATNAKTKATPLSVNRAGCFMFTTFRENYSKVFGPSAAADCLSLLDPKR